MKMAELVVSEIESENKFQIELKCDMCREDGVSVCVNCMDCLCKTCFDIHSHNAVLKAHTTITKDDLPGNFTSQTLHELKDMIICGKHETRFEYFCEDHTGFICQFCTRSDHRGCNRITKIQSGHSSPESVLNEIREIRNWFKDLTEQQGELKEPKSAEIKVKMKATTQAFLDLLCVSEEDGEIGEDTDRFDLIRDDINRVDKHEDLLRAVLFLNDTEAAMILSRRVKQNLENSPLKTSVESRTSRQIQMKKLSDRMEILAAVQDKLASESYCDVEDDYFNCMTYLVRGKTCTDAEVQTEPYQDTTEEQLKQACINDISSSHIKQQAAVGEARTYKNADVQTEGASNTSPTVRLVACTAEDLTASADVDTECDYDQSYRKSICSNVVKGSKDPYKVDRGCQTMDNTQAIEAELPLLVRPIGTYYVCMYGEQNCISGICVLRSGKIVLIDSVNNSLIVYDELFHFKTCFRLKWIPIDICVVNHDFERVAITFDSRRVETFEISEKEVCFVRGFDLSLNCRGMCCVSRDTIAVLVSEIGSLNDSLGFQDTNSDDDKIEIQIRDISNGRIISSMDTFDKDIYNPAYILQDNQNNILIGEDDQVSAFDEDGDRLWYYKGFKGNRLDTVYGMDMDPEGNIFVCSYGSNSIHQVSSYNYRNSRVIIPHVPEPISVTYDHREKRLLVGCGNSVVHIYKFC